MDAHPDRGSATRLLAPVLALGLALSACFPSRHDLEGLACDEAHPCPAPLSCQEAICRTGADDAAPSGVLFGDDFETGTLSAPEVPPGRWSTSTQNPEYSIRADSDAAHRGGFGLRATDSSTLARTSGAFLQAPCESSTSLFVRFWFKHAESAPVSDFYPLVIAPSGGASPTFANVGFVSAQVSLGGSDRAGTWTSNLAPQVADGGWHLLEVGLLGLGTPSGVRRFWLDGALQAERSGLDFEALATRYCRFGAAYSFSGDFQGSMLFDDFRAGIDSPASTLRVRSSVKSVEAGSCSRMDLELADSSGSLASAPYDVAAVLHSDTVEGGFFQDGHCRAPLDAVIAAGSTSTPIWFRGTGDGDTMLVASHPDFLSTPTPLAVQPAAGCGGCAAAGGDLPWLLTLCLLAAAVRRRRPGPGVALRHRMTTLRRAGLSA